MNACEFCLITEAEPYIFLTLRNLSNLYAFTNFQKFKATAVLCQYCWRRTAQCIKFLKLLKKSQESYKLESSLHLEIRSAYKYISLRYTSCCEECDDIAGEIKQENMFENVDVKDSIDTNTFMYEESSINNANLEPKVEISEDNSKLDFSEEYFDSNKIHSVADNENKPSINVTSNEIITDKLRIHSTKSGIVIESVFEKMEIKEDSGIVKKESDELKAEKYGLELVKLSLEEQRKEIEDRKRSNRYALAMFKCEKCGLSFQFEDIYSEHVTKFHSEAAGAHECTICHYRFTTSERLNSHERNAHARKWRCLKCSEVIKKINWYQHRNTCVEGQQHECDVCKKIFNTKIRLQMHKSSNHKWDGFTCDICKKRFTRKRSLQIHMRHHTGEKPHECEVCGKKFVAASYYRKHKQMRHTLVSPEQLYCVECNKYFKSKATLDTHLMYTNIHGGSSRYKHECGECKKKFIEHDQLLVHIKRFHDKIKDVPCPQCKKAFTTEHHLQLHIKRVHKRKKEIKKKLTCTICNATLKDKKGLRIHTMAKHEKLRPYVCDICNANFGYFSALYLHKKKKHGISKNIQNSDSVHTASATLRG